MPSDRCCESPAGPVGGVCLGRLALALFVTIDRQTPLLLLYIRYIYDDGGL